MTESTILVREKTKFRTFNYHTELQWIGRRAGFIHSEDRAAFQVSSPPEFKGEAGVWTPEHLFVASVEICAMTTFLAYAERKGLPILSYRSSAEGLLENVEGTYQFTKIILKPAITISGSTSAEQIRNTLEESHRKCFIANSIRTEVLLDPKIVTV